MSIFVVKFLLPVICLAPAISFASEGVAWRCLFALPFLLTSLFGASLAVIEITENGIRFRRTLKWHDLSPNRVLTAAPVWPPFIGRIELRDSIFPWGRLYFVLDKNLQLNPFHRGEFAMLRYLNREELAKPGQTADRVSKITSPTSKLLVGVLAGFLSSVMIFYLTPSSSFDPSSLKSSPNLPTVLRLQYEWLKWWPIQVAGLAVIAYLTAKRRNRPDAWVYGFLSGFGCTAILARWWS